jgi:hypothetical protein
MREIIITERQLDNALSQIQRHIDLFGGVFEDGRWWIFVKPEASPLFETGKRYHHTSFYFEMLAMSLSGIA